MRILFYSIEYSPELTGVSMACTSLAESLHSKQFEIKVVCPKKSKFASAYEKINGVEVYRVGRIRKKKRRFLSFVHNIIDLFTKIKFYFKFKPDIIIGQTWALEGGVTSGIIGKFFRCPSLMIVQASIPALLELYHYSRFKKWVYKLAFRLNKRIIVSHEEAQGNVSEHFNRESTIIPNCVNLEPLIKEKERSLLKQTYIQKYEFNSTKFNILSVGRLIPVKGYEFLISAMEELPECELNIIGTGPLEDTFMRMIEEKGIVNVNFLGRCSTEVVKDYMQISDLYISSSLSEGFSIAQLEAMLSGLPIASTPVGAIPTFIVHNVNGFIFEIENKNEIVKLVKDVLNQKHLLLEIRENAYETLAEQFSCESVSYKIIQLFRELGVNTNIQL